MHMYVYLCACEETKEYTAAKYLSVGWLKCVYMWGNMDVHINFRILECGKYTNFIAGSYFRLHAWSSTWWTVWGCTSVCERAVQLGVRMWEREKAFKGIEYILVCMSHDWLQMQVLFLHGTNSKHTRTYLKAPAYDYSVQSGSWNYLIYQGLTTFWGGNKWVLDPIFLEFFCSTCSSPAI